jgi:hypothetical protein
MAATEGRLQELAANSEQLNHQLVAIDHKVGSSLRAAHRQTQGLIAEAEGRWEKEMDQRTQVMDVRISRVEQNQSEDHARLARLNDQLEQEVGALRSDLAATQEGTRLGLASLHDQASENEHGLHNLTQQLHRERLNFEIVKDSPTELVPGVSLTILKADPSYQRIRGYVSFTAEGRTLWLENLGAQESVDLYQGNSPHPYSLIITQVNSRGAVGYLLMPAGV